MHSDVPFLPLENTYVTSMLSQPTEGIIIFNKTVIKRQFNLHVKDSVMSAIIKSNHDYRYQSKQPWKQLTFYCLDNIVRRLPNCKGKHGMSVVYWWDGIQSKLMTQWWKLYRTKCSLKEIKLTYFEKNKVYLHFYTFLYTLKFFLCSRKSHYVRLSWFWLG